jgi:hypothetical protein
LQLLEKLCTGISLRFPSKKQRNEPVAKKRKKIWRDEKKRKEKSFVLDHLFGLFGAGNAEQIFGQYREFFEHDRVFAERAVEAIWMPAQIFPLCRSKKKRRRKLSKSLGKVAIMNGKYLAAEIFKDFLLAAMALDEKILKNSKVRL